MPEYIEKFLKVRAKNHSEVFRHLNQHFLRIVPKYQALAIAQVNADRSNVFVTKENYPKWFNRVGDDFLFDLNIFHNVFISKIDRYHKSGLQCLINISLYDFKSNLIKFLRLPANQWFFEKEDIEEANKLGRIFGKINFSKDHLFKTKQQIERRLYDISHPTGLNFNDKIYKFYEDLNNALEDTIIHYIVLVLDLVKITGKLSGEDAKTNINRLSVFSESMKNFKNVDIDNFSKNPLYSSILDDLPYIQVFLKMVIQDKLVMNFGSADPDGVLKVVQDVYDILEKTNEKRCELVNEHKNNLICMSR